MSNLGRVLLVEDNEAERKALGQLLKAEGFSILGCESADKAMSYIDENIDVVLSDLHMGDVSGIDLLQLWKKRRPEVERAFRKAIGLERLPERTPLNPRLGAKHDFEGYTLQNVMFESRPGFPVTANLYRPKSPAQGKRPAILSPIGHFLSAGKAATERDRIESLGAGDDDAAGDADLGQQSVECRLNLVRDGEIVGVGGDRHGCQRGARAAGVISQGEGAVGDTDELQGLHGIGLVSRRGKQARGHRRRRRLRAAGRRGRRHGRRAR